MLQLYINDTLVDLSDDSPIALTFQINNLAEVKNQQGNTSNQFKIPLTQHNRRILGFPDDVAFCSDAPYKKYPAKLVQDGLEIIPYGLAELNSVDNDTASVTILSGNVDFFDAIDGKLYDMGEIFKPYEHKWDVDSVASSQTKTSGWIYPVIDYGNLPSYPQPINVNYLRPGFFIKTAIDEIVKKTGYRASGSLLNDPLYPKLIAQFSNSAWEHGTIFQNNEADDPYRCVVKTNADQTFNKNNYADRFRFYNTVVDKSNLWQTDNGNHVYRAPATLSVSVVFEFSVELMGDLSKNNEDQHFGIVFRIKKHPNADFLTDITIDLSTDTQPVTWQLYRRVANNVKLSYELELLQGEGVYVEYNVNNSKHGTVVVKQDATLTINTKRQNVLYGHNVQCERIFPDISAKDLLKDTLQRFGIICQTDNAKRTVSFNSFRDIVNNIPVAKNWSDKCLDQGKAISFQLGGYAQENKLKYKEDDAVLPIGFADAVIKVNDATLPASADLFESQFAPTLASPYMNSSVAQIKMTEHDGNEFNIGVAPRILIDQKLPLGGGKTVTFTDGRGNNRIVNDYISTPYFHKVDAPDIEGNYGQASLKFDNLRKRYYPELEKILKQTKKVVRYFLLTPLDILELDLMVPVYIEQDSAYYYINKIDAWRKGQATKVELVKLG
ncbi:hypothetical protein [Mucilaginibacter auburnensis]|uniref:Uncharacterized protein n=1 Tax=Mucilaginibacter auburnensis TaxID=1457233 RepID=A0A2H9VNS2_9SPHI|nr:hypothetical protein [Mucilaginibacter auburnensis]PJJ79960.1 hypothetical protein CLV57_3099 [Mucilaginibacter auburnensis]